MPNEKKNEFGARLEIECEADGRMSIHACIRIQLRTKQRSTQLAVGVLDALCILNRFNDLIALSVNKRENKIWLSSTFGTDKPFGNDP